MEVASPADRRGHDAQLSPFGRHGIKKGKSTFSTPWKAWTSLFTNDILQNIVKHTNDYGNRHCSKWKQIDRDELLKVFCVLWIASCEQRKSGPSLWFSEQWGSPKIKSFMSGRRFSQIVRGLHLSPVDNQSTHPDSKLEEFSKALMTQFRTCLEPDQGLSLDETLIRAF